MTTIHHVPDVIDLVGLSSGSAGKTAAAPGQTPQGQASPQTGLISPSPEVEITPTAQLLANVEQQISKIPDVDQSRVDSVRQALSAGTYQVESGRIADGLLAAQRFDVQATGQFGSDPA